MYCNQFNRSIPYYQGSTNPQDNATSGEAEGLWIGQLRAVYTNVDAARQCPEATDPFPDPNPNDVDRTGTAVNCWGPTSPTGADAFIGNQTGSYGFNGWLYWFNTATPAVRGLTSASVTASMLGLPGYPDPRADWYNFPFTPHSALIPTFADCIWPDGWPTPVDTVPPNLNVGIYLASDTGIPAQDPTGTTTRTGTTGAGIGHMGRFCIARHGHAINVAFADGHAETVPLQNLWALDWFPRYVRPQTLPTIPNH